MRHPNIAPCNCRTSQGATRQLRTLRLSHITPCDIAISHPATFACRTVRLKNLAFEPLNPVTHTRRYGHSCLPRSNRLPRHPAAFRHQPQTSPLQHTATSYILDPIQLGLNLLAQLESREMSSVSPSPSFGQDSRASTNDRFLCDLNETGRAASTPSGTRIT